MGRVPYQDSSRTFGMIFYMRSGNISNAFRFNLTLGMIFPSFNFFRACKKNAFPDPKSQDTHLYPEPKLPVGAGIRSVQVNGILFVNHGVITLDIFWL